MSGSARGVGVIDGVCGRKANNLMTMRFVRDRAEAPFATALQSGGDGVGKKLRLLVGLGHSGEGTHVITYADGPTLAVTVEGRSPTTVIRDDGSLACTITRGEPTTVTGPDGVPVLAFLPDPAPPAQSHLRHHVVDGARRHVATLDLVRPGGLYDDVGLSDVLDGIDSLASGFASDPGGALPLPYLGSRTLLVREPTRLEQDALVAASVELAIGLRRYLADPGS